MAKTRIVILGAGFGGVYTYKYLHQHFHKNHDVEIIILNQTNYFLFTPLLHEVATGGVNPQHIVEPLRCVLLCCQDDFWQATVRSVDLAARTIKTSLGELTYDYLVIALGSQPNFYGIPGAPENTFTLKSLEDALKIKRHVVSMFEKTSKEKNRAARKTLLNFVVVGGGATGVELAAELSELIYKTLPHYFFKIDFSEPKITLIEGGRDLLKLFSARLREKARDALARKNIALRFMTRANKITPAGIYLTDQTDKTTFMASRTVLWMAGVQAATITLHPEQKKDPLARIEVNEYLQLSAYPTVFAIGDCAFFSEKPDQPPLPPFAQVAVKQAQHVADSIAALIAHKKPPEFHYRHRGDLVSLGQWAAIGEIAGLLLWGHLTWLLWRTVYLSKMISMSKKMKIALDWAINIFSPRDISEI